jgi:hypothetical protein
MNWKQYEKELFAYFKSHYPEASVVFDVKKVGRYSKKERQIDILVEDSIADYPVTLVVDAKYYGKKVDVKDVESFIGKHPVKCVLKWYQPTNHITLFQKEYYGTYQTEYRRSI